MLFTYELTEKGKESFTESEGVATLSKVMQESDDDELVDSVIEIFTSLITDGEFSFKLNKMLDGEGGKRWGGGSMWAGLFVTFSHSGHMWNIIMLMLTQY